MIRLVKFLIIGGTGVAINLGLLALLTEIFGLYYMLSAVIVSFFGIAYNYLANNFWSFSDRKNNDMASGFGKFLTVMIMYSIIYYGGLYLFTELILKDFVFFIIKGYMIAAVLAIVIATIPKYVLCFLWVWKHEK